jgi:hypothetical protein
MKALFMASIVAYVITRLIVLNVDTIVGYIMTRMKALSMAPIVAYIITILITSIWLL